MKLNNNDLQFYPPRPIGELLEAIIDYRGKTPPKSISGIPVLTAANVKDGRITLEKYSYVSQETYDGWTTRGFPKPGDVLITTEAPVGEVASFPGDQTYLISRRLIALRGKKGELDNDFLKYSLLYAGNRDVLLALTRGSTVPRVLKTDITKLEIPIPPYHEQKKISQILNAFEKKIILNHQINQTLEAMAQAIFKSWFVDFEPVKAKIAAIKADEDADSVNRAAMRAISGRSDEGLDKMQVEQPEEYAQLKGTAELFPTAMWDSELGEVPVGWASSSVGAEFDAIMGQSPPGDTYNENGEGEPFFQGRRDFGWRYPDNRVYCTKPKRMAKKGDTLLSVRAPVGDINKATSDCCIGRGIASLRHKSGCEAYTYYTMMELSRNFKSFDSEGTVFGSINQKDLKALNVLKPSSSIVEAFTYAVGVMDQEILNLDKQVRVLSKLRDTLLPNLLSGEVCLAGLKVRDNV